MKLRKVISIFILTLSISISSGNIQAQCPMCKMSAESNLKHGGASGKGLNFGILYMLSLPYVIVGTVGYIWYRNRRKEDELVPEIKQFSEN